MTGPRSVESRSGPPIDSSAVAAFSMAMIRSAISSCRHSTRKAEQRCPAESKAELRTSATTCSASAELSTISAFWPPVSAISGIGSPSAPSLCASARWMIRATSVEPVNNTPAISGWAVSAAPTSPSPGSNLTTCSGAPASWRMRIASAATSGVSSAGLAMTTLPAAKAALACPMKIASGKFHGLMQATTPSGRCVALAKSPPSCDA